MGRIAIKCTDRGIFMDVLLTIGHIYLKAFITGCAVLVPRGGERWESYCVHVTGTHSTVQSQVLVERLSFNLIVLTSRCIEFTNTVCCDF